MDSHLVCVVVAYDALVFRQTKFAPLVSCKCKCGQEARSECILWSVVVGNYKKETQTEGLVQGCSLWNEQVSSRSWFSSVLYY